MDYTEIVIGIIDRVQIAYEWLVKLFGQIVGLFERFKDYILDLVYTLKQKLSSQDEIDNFIKNYIDNEHYFI